MLGAKVRVQERAFEVPPSVPKEVSAEAAGPEMQAGTQAWPGLGVLIALPLRLLPQAWCGRQ